ncbi:MAG: cation:proton antiporter [Treponema sp.]|nr:cation:proton antiporter [Treponema sp.]
MNNPLDSVLPEVLHFVKLQGTQLVFLLGVILFFGAIGGRIFQRLKIPQVVGYIVIGIIIGSSGFQVLGAQTIAALSPISTAALSFIGFLVGSELKLGVIKKYGRQFTGILLGETVTPFFVVGILVTAVYWAFTRDIITSVSLGLLLGAICSATAPAATTDVLKEYRTRGPLTTTVLGLVAMDDAVALILYAVAGSIAAPLLGGTKISFGMQMLSIARDIFGSILIGSAFGFVISRVIKNLMQDEGRVLSFALGGIFLCTGLCELLDLDNILAAMSVGFFMVNFAPVKTRPVFKLVERFTPPVYVLFFVLVGAKLNIWVVTPVLGAIALVYVAGRTLGKSIGCRIGAKLTHAPATVRKYLPWCLLSQAGVAIGLSIAASNDFPDSVGPQIILIITATTFIVQILGPLCVRHGIIKAGEAGLDITEEDILKQSQVQDVTWGNEKSCNAQSSAIVNETDTLRNILDNFSVHHNQSFAVRSASGKLSGIISLEHLKETLQFSELAETMLALDIMDKPEQTCTPDLSLPDLYKYFSDTDTEFMPIVNDKGEPLGVIEKFAVDHYVHRRILELNAKVESLG